MQIEIKNQHNKYIGCKTQRSAILDMIKRGLDMKVIDGSLVEIVKSYRDDKVHEVVVKVHL